MPKAEERAGGARSGPRAPAARPPRDPPFEDLPAAPSVEGAGAEAGATEREPTAEGPKPNGPWGLVLPDHLAVRLPALMALLLLVHAWLQQHLGIELTAEALGLGGLAIALPAARRVWSALRPNVEEDLRAAVQRSLDLVLSTPVLTVLTLVAFLAGLTVSSVTVVAAGAPGPLTVRVRPEGEASEGSVWSALLDRDALRRTLDELASDAEVRTILDGDPDSETIQERLRSTLDPRLADLALRRYLEDVAPRVSDGLVSRLQNLLGLSDVRILRGSDDKVSFPLLTTPFGKPYRIEIAGYRRHSFDLYPGVDARIRVTEDLRLLPSLLVRVPHAARTNLEGGVLRLYELTGAPGRAEDGGGAAGRRLVGEQATEDGRGSVLFGHDVAVPDERLAVWELEVRVLDLRGAGGGALLQSWRTPLFVPLAEGLAPGTPMEAEFCAASGAVVARLSFRIGDDPFQDRVLDPVEPR